MKKSAFLRLNIQDFLKGLIVAIGGGVVALIETSTKNGSFVFDWTAIWHTAVAAGLAYIGKNLFSSTPKTVQIDPEKTSVVDVKTKETILNANN